MGILLNGGISEFRQTLNSEIYVDKTDMIGAYYEKGSNSRLLFEGRKLSKIHNWDREMNKYNVIRIDIAEILSFRESAEKALDYLESAIIGELKHVFPTLARCCRAN